MNIFEIEINKSNKAHYNLMLRNRKLFYSSAKTDHQKARNSQFKMVYHAHIIDTQKEKKTKLSSDEKKIIYKSLRNMVDKYHVFPFSETLYELDRNESKKKRNIKP